MNITVANPGGVASVQHAPHGRKFRCTIEDVQNGRALTLMCCIGYLYMHHRMLAPMGRFFAAYTARWVIADLQCRGSTRDVTSWLRAISRDWDWRYARV